jgi:hypothetical protein
MDLGWNPPEPRSRWDILLVVAMAKGDEPMWAELPTELVKPIHIASKLQRRIRCSRFEVVSLPGSKSARFRHRWCPIYCSAVPRLVRVFYHHFRYQILTF